MAYGFLKSEVGHHAGKTLLEDVTATFNRLLALLTTFGCLKTLKKLLKVTKVKVGGSVSAGVGESVHFCTL
jgi:hypothetical protein